MPPTSEKLLKALGIVFGLAVTLGGTFGVGILRTPGQIVASTPNSWWMMSLWLAVGLYILASALTLSELAMSRDRLFWVDALGVNRRGTSRNALLISSVCAIAMLFAGSFDALLEITGVFTVMSYALAFVSLVVLRRKRPDALRPFRVPAYPWLPGLVIAASAGFLVLALSEGKRDTLAAFDLVACSFPIYLLCKSVVLQRSTSSSR
ncbi:MAG: amino acid permease [Acidobacteriota bacterium]|nr:amino acid permease [Acidobacteriota bacterium]